jgi:glutaconate CoA-transferase subunit B
MTDWSRAELMSVVLSRQLSDGDVVITGTNAAIPAGAYRMAQKLGAPTLTGISGGLGTVDPTAAVVPPSSADQDLLDGLFNIPLPEIVRMEVGRRIDVIFLGALQVDRRGRCNLAAVGPYDAPTLRGPGTLGLSLVAVVPKTLMYITRHDPRTFVESVDFLSAEGLRPDGAGLQAIVTPLAVLGPAAGGEEVGLISVHPGVSIEEVVARTGFDLEVEGVGETPAPSAEELAVLREVDRRGQLRHLDLERS